MGSGLGLGLGVGLGPGLGFGRGLERRGRALDAMTYAQRKTKTAG